LVSEPSTWPLNLACGAPVSDPAHCGDALSSRRVGDRRSGDVPGTRLTRLAGDRLALPSGSRGELRGERLVRADGRRGQYSAAGGTGPLALGPVDDSTRDVPPGEVRRGKRHHRLPPPGWHCSHSLHGEGLPVNGLAANPGALRSPRGDRQFAGRRAEPSGGAGTGLRATRGDRGDRKLPPRTRSNRIISSTRCWRSSRRS